MGLTENQKRLIIAIAQKDMVSARKCAVACLGEDSTAKNKTFVKKYSTILTSADENMIQLPQDLAKYVCVEEVSASFKEGRYFLSEREKRLFSDIVKMKKVSEKMSELGISYINSSLLYGESGTGKTTFGRYVAYKTGLPFCYLKFSNLVSSYMGNTSQNISKAFSWAIENPCVFMLDEIDCISISRSGASNSGADGEMGRITISLMQEFDRLPNDVIVIGATNRKDRIDEALLRRFTIHHEVKRLSESERSEMVSKFFDDIHFLLTDAQLYGLINPEDTQAGLMNRMISLLADHFMEESGESES